MGDKYGHAALAPTYHETISKGTPVGDDEGYKNTNIKPFNGKYLEAQYTKAAKKRKGAIYATLEAIKSTTSHTEKLTGSEADFIKNLAMGIP